MCSKKCCQKKLFMQKVNVWKEKRKLNKLDYSLIIQLNVIACEQHQLKRSLLKLRNEKKTKT